MKWIVEFHDCQPATVTADTYHAAIAAAREAIQRPTARLIRCYKSK
jgi:hypothetical protein